MILDMDGKALVLGIETRAARHGPTFQHPVQLQTEIIVQPRGRVLLNQIAVSLVRTDTPPEGSEVFVKSRLAR